jgi:photosystem II stability/assembly factor-like uncharacterized protein
LRGLAVRDATRAWASGSGGTVLRTRDGHRWEKLTVPGGGELDFRDVEAVSGDTVVLMAAGPGGESRIYRSLDAGETWTLAHTNPDRDGFYDAIAFWDAKGGLLLGDPVRGRFVVRVTGDGGRTWYAPKGLIMPEALEGEGAFAASGTCLYALKGGTPIRPEARRSHASSTPTIAAAPGPSRRRPSPRPTRPRDSSRSSSPTRSGASLWEATTSSPSSPA